MRRQDHERALTYQIARLTDDLNFFRGEIVDPTIVLLILRIAVEHDARDAVLDSGGEFLNGTVVHRRTLTVATADDDGVGTLVRHGREGVFQKVLGYGIGAAGEQIGGEERGVVDAFCRNCRVTEYLLEGV